MLEQICIVCKTEDCVCVHMWRPEVDITMFFLIAFHLIFGDSYLSLSLQLTHLTRLAGQQAAGLLLSLSP